MTRYVNLKLTEYEFGVVRDLIGKHHGSIDSGDDRFDETVTKLYKKLFKINVELSMETLG